jgi:hypothetical protein
MCRVLLSPVMDAPLPPTVDATLAELASLGMRAARAATRMIEIEVQTAEMLASWCPERGAEPASLTEATTAGQAIDIANAQMADAVPRVEVLARALDRLSRSVRRCIGLQLRIAAGWPRCASDSGPAMVKRQVARGVSQAIRHAADGEAAERLFDELAERLQDPELDIEIGALPVDEIVRRICRDLGLMDWDLVTGAPEPGPPLHPERPNDNTS